MEAAFPSPESPGPFDVPAGCLFADVGGIDRETIEHRFDYALALGVDLTEASADDEQLLALPDLACLAADVLVEVALSAQATQTLARLLGRSHPLFIADARGLRDLSAGAVRLLWRTLEVDSRDLGYALTVWRGRTLDVAGDVLRHGARQSGHGRLHGAPISVARAACWQLNNAIAAFHRDRMTVPEQIVEALGRTTALFIVAVAAADTR